MDKTTSDIIRENRMASMSDLGKMIHMALKPANPQEQIDNLAKLQQAAADFRSRNPVDNVNTLQQMGVDV